MNSIYNSGKLLVVEDEVPQFILLDLMMPIMNGWEFLVAQRSDSKLKEIVRKPIDLDQLISLVKQHCDPAMNYEKVS